MKNITNRVIWILIIGLIILTLPLSLLVLAWRIAANQSNEMLLWLNKNL